MATSRGMQVTSLALLMLSIIGVPTAFSDTSRPAAVFPVELWDTSGEGEKEGQSERLALATRVLAEGLVATGIYRPVDLTPFVDDLEHMQRRYVCNGCWREVAGQAGAEVAVLTVVHKVSTLVSTMSIWIEDLRTRTFVANAQVQFRGETDEAYVRAINFILKRGYLRRQMNDAGSNAPG